MKKLIALLACVVLWGFPGCELDPKYPKHDINTTALFLEEGQDKYYLFSGMDGHIKEYFNKEEDTITVNDTLYRYVFFAKIVREKLNKRYNNVPDYPLGQKQLFIKGGLVRKQVPGYGSREFLVAEDVVGVQ